MIDLIITIFVCAVLFIPALILGVLIVCGLFFCGALVVVGVMEALESFAKWRVDRVRAKILKAAK